MDLIFGILSRNKGIKAIDFLNNEIAQSGDATINKCNAWNNGSVYFSALHFSTPLSYKNKNIPYFDEEAQCCIISDSRLEYRKELIEDLGMKWKDNFETEDNQLIIKAYQKWDTDFVKHLFGDFAFSIWDDRKQILICIRDHFGFKPLYYITTKDYFIFSSHINGFKDISNVSLNIKEQFFLDSICGILSEKHISAFNDVNKVEPAHMLIVTKKTELSKTKYWNLHILDKYAALSEEQSINGLKARFIESVIQKTRTKHPLGIELSGGIDSSSIASVIFQYLGDYDAFLHCFSHTLSTEKLLYPSSHNNELSSIEDVLALGNQFDHQHITGEDHRGCLISVENAIRMNSRPVVQGYAMLSDLLYERAQAKGVRVLLSGFGGDEGITYQGSGFFEELASKRDFKFLREQIYIRNRQYGGCYLRNIIHMYFAGFLPNWYSFLYKNFFISNKGLKERFSNFGIDSRKAKKYEQRKRYLRKNRAVISPSIRYRQYQRIMHPHISDRIENSYFAALNHGIEYRYPFLDVKLVEFYYSIDTKYKYKNGLGRYVFRMAMKDILPDSVRLNNDKTAASIPYVKRRILKDEAAFREIIEEGRNNNQNHYVNYDKLIWMLDQFKVQGREEKINFTPRAFLSPISVLVFQKWQREGKIDIGIQ